MSINYNPPRTILFLLVILLLGGIAGCRNNSNSSSSNGTNPAAKKEYTIVTTTGMVADIVRHVAGDHADVIGLMAEGVDPHLYTPTRNDIQKMMNADVVLYSGLLLEGQMQGDFKTMQTNGKSVFAVTDCLEKSFLRNPSEFEGHPDPHVWMDVTAWKKCVTEVADKLTEFDKPNAADYQKNAQEYQKKLTRLDEYIKKIIKTIPEKQRVLVTAHDAFGYFARAYSITVRSVQGISTEAEPSIDDINKLIDFIVENKVPAIFIESSVSEKSIQAIRDGVQQRKAKVALGGSLFSDAMGATGTYEGTYIGMLDHNATLIVHALGGTAPEKGFQGKLTLMH